jgi:hypothetical protein
VQQRAAQKISLTFVEKSNKQIHFALFEKEKERSTKYWNCSKNKKKNKLGIRSNSSICEATLEYMEM